MPIPKASRVLEHDWYDRPVPKNVSLGVGTWLHSGHAFEHFRSRREGAVVTGRSCGIYVGTHFELGPDGEVAMGDYVTVNGAVFSTNARITIGSHVLISWSVTIAASFAAVPADVANEEPSRDIAIGDDCWIGTRAILLGGAKLGRGVIVGAAAVVGIEVPDFAVVAGNPARIVGSVRSKGGH